MNEAGLAGIDLPPFAPMLMQSLRAVGYTTSAALADLIDNSIAAEAHAVAIMFATTSAPYVAIIDDGHGMDEAALVAAMRFGSRDPRDARVGTDLGRFGLGLKTASLSQCSRLVVASLAGGHPFSACATRLRSAALISSSDGSVSRPNVEWRPSSARTIQRRSRCTLFVACGMRCSPALVNLVFMSIHTR